MKSALARRTVASIKAYAGLFGAWLLIFGFFSWRRPDTFATAENLEAIARQGTVTCFAALGMTLVIVGGGIDLSVGSLVALVTVVIAVVLTATKSVALAVLAAVSVGAFVGLINGALITRLKVLPFIVTLGSLLFVRGAATGLGKEAVVSAPKTALAGLLEKLDAGERWRILPIGVWALLIAAALVSLLLGRTVFGRHVVAVGSNESAARLCGVSIDRTKCLMYVLMGVFAALAGIMMYSRLSVGDPTVADGLELDVIAAVVIGGASLSGGQGSIIGTLFGVLIMTTINDGCTQINLPNWVQKIVTGVIIVFAVTLDRWRATHRK